MEVTSMSAMLGGMAPVASVLWNADGCSKQRRDMNWAHNG